MFGRYWRKCPPGPSCAHAPRLPRPNAPPMRARKEPTCKPLGKPGREDGPHERPTVIRVSGWSAAVRVVCCACVCVLGGRGPARVQAARARVRVRECEGVGESRGGHPRFLGAPHWCEKREASHQTKSSTSMIFPAPETPAHPRISPSQRAGETRHCPCAIETALCWLCLGCGSHTLAR